MRLLTALSLTFLLAGLSAQETAKEVFDKLATAQKELAAGGARPDKAKVDAFQQSVKDALAANAKLLAEGDGLYYRGRLQMMARDNKAAVASLQAYLDAKPTSDLVHEARVVAAQMSMNSKDGNARELLAAVKADKLSEASRKALEGMQAQFKAEDTRNGITGKPVPAFAAIKTLNAPADFALDKCQGKVVVMDFWATWCPPCRQIIPDLVKLQEQHGAAGLQVVGVTRYYGYGMDFDESSKLPHGGKSVGSREKDKAIGHDEEVKVNENFVKAFKLNYPVVFSEAEVGKETFGITGIPTVFVVGRDGKVVGHIVGGGEENHAKLEKMIAEALGNKATDASARKNGD